MLVIDQVEVAVMIDHSYSLPPTLSPEVFLPHSVVIGKTVIPIQSNGEGPQWLKLDVNQQQQVNISLVWFGTSVSLVYLDGCMGRWMVTK